MTVSRRGQVVKAKAGGGSATLSMAYAGARLAGAVLRGLSVSTHYTQITHTYYTFILPYSLN